MVGELALEFILIEEWSFERFLRGLGLIEFNFGGLEGVWGCFMGRFDAFGRGLWGFEGSFLVIGVFYQS
jgi:hypothetical protein